MGVLGDPRQDLHQDLSDDAEEQCGVERPIICVADVRAAKCVRSIRALTDISNGVA